MFTTSPNYLIADDSEDTDKEDLTYVSGKITDHEPFFILTISATKLGKIGFHTELFTNICNFNSRLKNSKVAKVRKLQLMHPMGNLLDGWKIHDIVLARTDKNSDDEEFDEYITSEGIVFRFEKNTLIDFENFESSEQINYQSCNDSFFEASG